jgi:hypothetical protein
MEKFIRLIASCLAREKEELMLISELNKMAIESKSSSLKGVAFEETRRAIRHLRLFKWATLVSFVICFFIYFKVL